MAGAGYKLFNAGDILTAGQVNTYLNEQSVMVFATTAARDSALTGVLAEGMVCYIKDITGNGTAGACVYDGSAWKIVWSEWETFTPTWSNGVTVGNGTYISSRWAYVALGQYKLEVVFELGSTSAITGGVELDLPITIDNGRVATGLNIVLFNDNAAYPGMTGHRNSGTTYVYAVNTSGTYAVRKSLSATIPFTWGSADRIAVVGVLGTP